MSSSSVQYRRQRIDGSMPCTRTTAARSTGGVSRRRPRSVGQVISPAPVRPCATTVGRLTWKSWYSSGSSSSTCSASQHLVQVLQRLGRRRPGVVPALERREQHGLAGGEVRGWRLAHRASLGRLGAGPDGPCPARRHRLDDGPCP